MLDLRVLLLVFGLLLQSIQNGAAQQNYVSDLPGNPNLIVILADDMGYGDLTSYGSQHVSTPNLSKLAESGVTFSRAYVTSSVCSPSRAGIMTGRDPRRFGYQANLNKRAEGYPTRPTLQGLPVGEHTLGDQLKHAGYQTALFGKWHLGTGDIFHPNQRGFDHFYGMLNGSHNYFPDAKNSRLEINGQRLSEFDGEYLTDLLTTRAMDWIDEKQDEGQPWFAFLSYNAPHTPMQAKESDLQIYQAISNKKRRTYAAMMHALDQNIGRLREHLRNAGCLDNTFIVFLSDNGGATNNGSWNGELSGAKGCLREGGIRVPMIFSWPAELKNGQISRDVVSSLDLMPTLVAAAGSQPMKLDAPTTYEDPRNRKRAVKKFGSYDGINLLPVLTGKKQMPERKLYFRLQGQAAVITGKYKLIRLNHRPAQLFDIVSDPSEAQDLAASYPDKTAELFATLGDWEFSMPTAPLWASSPFWDGDSAKIYDSFGVVSESELGK